MVRPRASLAALHARRTAELAIRATAISRVRHVKHRDLNQASGHTGKTPEPSWLRQLVWAVKGLLRQPVQLARTICSDAEGRPEVLQTEIVIGRLLALLKSRQAYVRSIEQLRQASWRQAVRPAGRASKTKFPSMSKRTPGKA